MKGIVIAGPTGVGKTNISIKMAKAINGEIISADSAQVYKGLNIGTAKISRDEMKNIKHYMLDIINPGDDFNVGEYQNKVDKVLNSLRNNAVPIIVGGTGLYIDSVVRGLSNLPSKNTYYREMLEKKDKKELYQELQRVDEVAAKNIDKNNISRIIRALEVFYLTGEKFSKLSKKNIKNNFYKFSKFLLIRPKDSLYSRINLRIDMMFENGLLEEAKKIYEEYNSLKNKIKIIGYQELFFYFDGEITFEEAKNLIKKNSRRYAKRQLTWFKQKKDYITFNLDEVKEKEIITNILLKCKNDYLENLK